MCSGRLVFLAVVASYYSVVKASMCTEEVEIFRWPRSSASAPVSSSRYLQELSSLEERALKDIARELERLESSARGLKQVGFVEQLILKQLGDIGADLGRLSSVVNAMGCNSGRGSANTDVLLKHTCGFERKLKRLENVERLVKEESAVLGGIIAEKTWCFGHVIMKHEHHRGCRRYRTTDSDSLRNLLKRLEHFEGLRENLSCTRIKTLELRSLDVEELKRDLGNEGLCPEDLESPEGIAGLQKTLLEMIERVEQPESGRGNIENIESVRRRYAERLSLRGLCLGDIMRLTESIDEKFEKPESLEKIGERIARLQKDLRSSVIERPADLPSFEDLDRTANSEKLFHIGYHCYESKDEQRRHAKMLLSLSRECSERLRRSLALRRYLGASFFVLRAWFEYLLRPTGSKSVDCTRTSVDIYTDFTKLGKEPAEDLERLLERTIKDNVAISKEDHVKNGFLAQKLEKNIFKSNINTVQRHVSFKNTEGASRKPTRTILAAIPEERNVHERIELLIRSTCDVLSVYREVESSRHSDLARARESAEREICSLREDLQRLAE